MSRSNNRMIKRQHRELDSKRNPRNRAELIDFDYLHKLNPEELKFMKQFTDEWYNATIPKENAMHVTPEERSMCWRNNNKRNRDLYSYKRSTDKIHFFSNISDSKRCPDQNPEEKILGDEQIEADKRHLELVRKIMKDNE